MAQFYEPKESNSMQQWKFNRAGKEETVPLERWCWGVVYDNGTELHQFDSKGVYHQVGEIDQERVTMFSLYKPDMSKRIDLHITEDMKLVHNYKLIKPYYRKDFVTVYCFGYKKKGQHHLLHILPDDRIVMSDTEAIDLASYRA
jgi:hypothetical protein